MCVGSFQNAIHSKILEEFMGKIEIQTVCFVTVLLAENDIASYPSILIRYNVFSITRSFSQLLSNSYTMGCPPVRGDNPRA